MYPYQREFISYCSTIKKLSKLSLFDTDKCISTFWSYYEVNSITEARLDNITLSDIKDFLAQLDQKLNFTIRTINKYISYIKQYFNYLYTTQKIKTYPIASLRGIEYDRKKLFYINWTSSLNELDKSSHLSSVTMKVLTLISMGFTPQSLISLTWNDLLEYNDNAKKQILEKYLNFEKNDNPYLFSKKNGTPYKSLESIKAALKLDQKYVPFCLKLENLRREYILTLVNNSNLTDKELEYKLQCSDKSLNYYKHLLLVNKIIDYQDL